MSATAAKLETKSGLGGSGSIPSSKSVHSDACNASQIVNAMNHFVNSTRSPLKRGGLERPPGKSSPAAIASFMKAKKKRKYATRRLRVSRAHVTAVATIRRRSAITSSKKTTKSTKSSVTRDVINHLRSRRRRGQSWNTYANTAVAQTARKRARVPPKEGSSGQANVGRSVNLGQSIAGRSGQVATSLWYTSGTMKTSKAVMTKVSASHTQLRFVKFAAE